jgi:glycosyltransferase involved in cell wall biosynthesis
MSDRISVLWLVKGLGPGGAERLLVAAAAAHDRDAFDLQVVYLLPWKQHLVPELEALGVRCTCLDVNNERDVRWARRLRTELRGERVDVVHSHSPYAAAVGRLVVRSLPRASRPALVATEHNPWSTFKPPTRYANAWTARLDDADLAVSEEARASMSRRQRERTEVLVHGVDVAAIAKLRAERAMPFSSGRWRTTTRRRTGRTCCARRGSSPITILPSGSASWVKVRSSPKSRRCTASSDSRAW